MNRKIILYLLLAILVVTGIVITVMITGRNAQKNVSTPEEIGLSSALMDDTFDEQKPISTSTQPSSADDTEKEQQISYVEQDATSDIGSPAKAEPTEQNLPAPGTTSLLTEKQEVQESTGTVFPDLEESNLPVLEIESAAASTGDSDVVLAVSIKKNPGILGMSFILHYDDEALRLTKVTPGIAFSELRFTAPKKLDSGCVFTWYGESLDENEIRDGTILTLHFSVAESAKKNNYSVELVGYDGNCYDKDLSEVSFDVHNGSVSIK